MFLGSPFILDISGIHRCDHLPGVGDNTEDPDPAVTEELVQGWLK